jgi:hypothetical protein
VIRITSVRIGGILVYFVLHAIGWGTYNCRIKNEIFPDFYYFYLFITSQGLDQFSRCLTLSYAIEITCFTNALRKWLSKRCNLLKKTAAVGDCTYTGRNLQSTFRVSNDCGNCTLNKKYHLKFRKINKVLFVLVFLN